MVREDGVQVKFVISESVWKAFRAEIGVKEPYIYKGLLSTEAEKAFQLYIMHSRKRRSSMQHSTQQQQSVKKLDELYELKDKIFQYFQDTEIELGDKFGIFWPEGIPPRKIVPSKYLFQVIGALKGTDRRTIKKWTRRLLNADLIEGTGAKEYTFCEQEPKTIDTSLDKASTNQEPVSEEERKRLEFIEERRRKYTSKVNEQPVTLKE